MLTSLHQNSPSRQQLVVEVGVTRLINTLISVLNLGRELVDVTTTTIEIETIVIDKITVEANSVVVETTGTITGEETIITTSMINNTAVVVIATNANTLKNNSQSNKAKAVRISKHKNPSRIVGMVVITTITTRSLVIKIMVRNSESNSNLQNNNKRSRTIRLRGQARDLETPG